VGRAVATALTADTTTLWVPRSLAGLAAIMRLVPRPVWRRLSR
jgi:decaprenylphospho-beta-D-erythro-pentofuranosid-2-ulose 2-reductase